MKFLAAFTEAALQVLEAAIKIIILVLAYLILALALMIFILGFLLLIPLLYTISFIFKGTINIEFLNFTFIGPKNNIFNLKIEIKWIYLEYLDLDLPYVELSSTIKDINIISIKFGLITEDSDTNLPNNNKSNGLEKKNSLDNSIRYNNNDPFEGWIQLFQGITFGFSLLAAYYTIATAIAFSCQGPMSYTSLGITIIAIILNLAFIILTILGFTPEPFTDMWYYGVGFGLILGAFIGLNIASNNVASIFTNYALFLFILDLLFFIINDIYYTFFGEALLESIGIPSFLELLLELYFVNIAFWALIASASGVVLASNPDKGFNIGMPSFIFWGVVAVGFICMGIFTDIMQYAP
jgi:hypothetical protein